MFTDVRYALRSLGRSPGLCLAAASVLGASAAVAATVFSAVDAVLLAPLPVRAPDQLHFIYSADRSRLSGVSNDVYEALRARTDVFAQLGASAQDRGRLSGATDTEREITGEAVSDNYFDVLGLTAVAGRTFTAAEPQQPVMVISEDLFKARFGADPAIVGSTVRLQPRARGVSTEPGSVYTIIGVMSGGFRGLVSPWQRTQYWVPLHSRARDYRCDDPEYLQGHLLVPFARLSPAVSERAAGTRIAALQEQGPGAAAQSRSTLIIRGSRRVSLPFDASASIVPENLALALMCVCLLLLVIAATNMVGTLLARSVSRRGDVATRLMLGASPSRLIAATCVEGGALAVLGTVVGLGCAVFLTQVLAASVPAEFGAIVSKTVSLDVQVNGRTIAAMAAVAAIATLLISVPPALLLSRMRRLGHSSGLRTLGYRHTRAQLEWGVMVPQIAFSVMLLSIAGVLIRTLVDVERKDLGFATDRVAFVEFEIPRPGRCLIRNADAQLAYADHRRHVIEEIERLVRGSQETDAVALALFLPPDNVGSARVVARAPAGETSASIPVVRSDVGSGYFNVLGVPLLSGRDFDKTDQQGAQPVAIVSRRLAERLWPGRSPVGDLLGFLDGTSASPSSWRHVVGVVGDIDAGDRGQPPTEAVYIPAAQGLSARTVLARYLGPLADGMSALKKAVISADANVEIVRAGSLDDTMQTRRYPRRLATILLVICGGVGLLFSAIGLYGISSYAVNQRMRELALRMALGADGGTLRRSVLLRGWRIGVSGTAAGVILGVIGTRLFSRFVMPLPGLDATGLMIVSAVVMVVMTAAAAGPARRAAQVDPAEVLRQA